ncbi:hypothetical protein OG775_08250 [Streptomyces platensis]|nr:hypothetical protein [Streptomyces platensis]MCX4635136.1 hypothetical protein [Streptomyces platensis]
MSFSTTYAGWNTVERLDGALEVIAQPLRCEVFVDPPVPAEFHVGGRQGEGDFVAAQGDASLDQVCGREVGDEADGVAFEGREGSGGVGGDGCRDVA